MPRNHAADDGTRRATLRCQEKNSGRADKKACLRDYLAKKAAATVTSTGGTACDDALEPRDNFTQQQACSTCASAPAACRFVCSKNGEHGMLMRM